MFSVHLHFRVKQLPTPIIKPLRRSNPATVLVSESFSPAKGLKFRWVLSFLNRYRPTDRYSLRLALRDTGVVSFHLQLYSLSAPSHHNTSPTVWMTQSLTQANWQFITLSLIRFTKWMSGWVPHYGVTRLSSHTAFSYCWCLLVWEQFCSSGTILLYRSYWSGCCMVGI